MGWRLINNIFIIGVFILLPCLSPSVAANPPNDEPAPGNDCIIYAYSSSINHLFLLESDKTAFGNNMTIIHNCEYVEVYVNNTFVAYSELQQLVIPLDYGLNNISILTDNYTKRIENLNLIPDRLNWEFEYYDFENRDKISFDEYISISKAQAQENWVSILSIVVVFTLVTMVYWNLINAYIDRNFCEEVKA